MQYYSLLFAARGRLLLVVPDGKKKMLADLTLTQESFQRSWGEGCSYRTIAKKISPCTPPFRRWCIMYMRCQTWVLYRRRLYKHKLNKSCPNFNWFCIICIIKFKTKEKNGYWQIWVEVENVQSKMVTVYKTFKILQMKGWVYTQSTPDIRSTYV